MRGENGIITLRNVNLDLKLRPNFLICVGEYSE